MSIGIKPLKDNVALKAKTVEESTTSGIIIPGDKDEQKNFAEVVAVGDGGYGIVFRICRYKGKTRF